MIFEYGDALITIGKAILLAFFGVVLAFLTKHYLRKLIDKGILKKIIKDPSLYDASSVFNKIFTEIIQWIIILAFLNKSFLLLEINFFGKTISYLIQNGPFFIGFLAIAGSGILISKIISSVIKKREIEYKWEIVTLSEVVIISAFVLTAFEFIGVRATALIELYKVILYIIGAIILILIVNPKILKEQAKPKKK